MLGISADEGTAWIVRGDTATIVGPSKAFVYGSKEINDSGKPFLTLYPGDRFNLAERRVMHRAAAESPVSIAFVDSLLEKHARAGAAVLVAQNGDVFIDKSYGLAPQPRYMPTTTVPQFAIGAMSGVFTSFCAQLPIPPQRCLPAVLGGIGMHKTSTTAAAGDSGMLSSVDELYRWSLLIPAARVVVDPTADAAEFSRKFDADRGWQLDTYRGVARYRVFAQSNGKRGVFVRMPERNATVIVLTNDDSADAVGLGDRITDRLLTGKR